jgi:large subunit ribosomal protein L35Ae
MTKAVATKRPPRLYVEGAILGYSRGQRNQYQHVSLIKIKNVDTTVDAEFYCGKKIAFVTKTKGPKNKDGTKAKQFRVQWGKVCRPHGSNGVVRCRFKRNLPPQAMGGRVRVMLYPSSI